MISSENGSGKDQTFELNLVPFIDVLSTCICFLLMTAIWINVGVLNVSQALGSEPPANGKNPPSVIADIKNDGSVQLSLKDVGANKKPTMYDVRASGGHIDWERVEAYVGTLQANIPELKTALVMPSARTKYEDVIRIMDMFKKSKITDIGIAPLTGT
jgi:biopolymer transport protein TolR